MSQIKLPLGSLRSLGAVLDLTDPLRALLNQGDSRATGSNSVEEAPGADDGPVSKTVRGQSTFRWTPTYHPFATEFLDRFIRLGPDGLYGERYDVASQELNDPESGDVSGAGETFVDRYAPIEANVLAPWPTETVDFRRTSTNALYDAVVGSGHARAGGAYANYNWELFFHIPLFVVRRLSTTGRHEEAQRWLHYVFDPSKASEAPDAVWRFRPLADPVSAGLPAVDHPTPLGEYARWLADPFDPHGVATLRIIAYRRSVFFHYLDNLIAWGDSLFRQEQREPIAEAAIHYLTAQNLLGPRPLRLPGPTEPASRSYTALRNRSHALNTARQARIEQFEAGLYGLTDDLPDATVAFLTPSLTAFSTPINDRFIAYWDAVEDRLFKLRNSLSIDGNFRVLPLYAPPIDPAILVRARALGLDLGDVLRQLNGTAMAVPPARFRTMLAQARGYASDVRQLGAGLLSALEKQDAETLAEMRAGHEVTLLARQREVRVLSVREAGQNVLALEASRDAAQARADWYVALLGRGLNSDERTQLGLLQTAFVLSMVGQSISVTGGIISAFGQVEVGTSGVNILSGPDFVGRLLQAVGQGFGVAADAHTQIASRHAILGGYARRREDWTLQRDLARREVTQVSQQLEAGRTRATMAEKELASHDLQAQQSAMALDYLRTKYTRTQLYTWMAEELRRLHRSAYSTAVDAARAAERAYRFEIGVEDAAFVGATSVDQGYEGFVAGDRLTNDLNRMESSFVSSRPREHEMVKNISLLQWDPVALLQLRESGACFLRTDEAMFDIDGPGHYYRRIRSVAVSVQCTPAPHDSVPLKLSMTDSWIRLTPSGPTEDPVGSSSAANDRVWRQVRAPLQSIVTSTGNRDTGTSETWDDRYRPFENQGVVGHWRMQLPSAHPAFSYGTITDVILHVTYTARDGGDVWRSVVEESLGARLAARLSAIDALRGRRVAFSVRATDPDAWQHFKATGDASTLPLLPRAGSVSSWMNGAAGSLSVDVLVVGASSAVPVPRIGLRGPPGSGWGGSGAASNTAFSPRVRRATFAILGTPPAGGNQAMLEGGWTLELLEATQSAPPAYDAWVPASGVRADLDDVLVVFTLDGLATP